MDTPETRRLGRQERRPPCCAINTCNLPDLVNAPQDAAGSLAADTAAVSGATLSGTCNIMGRSGERRCRRRPDIVWALAPRDNWRADFCSITRFKAKEVACGSPESAAAQEGFHLQLAPTFPPLTGARQRRYCDQHGGQVTSVRRHGAACRLQQGSSNGPLARPVSRLPCIRRRSEAQLSEIRAPIGRRPLECEGRVPPPPASWPPERPINLNAATNCRCPPSSRARSPRASECPEKTCE